MAVNKVVMEKCPEAKHYEAYDWCELSDNICIRNTGNSNFDVECDWYNEFLEEISNSSISTQKEIK